MAVKKVKKEVEVVVEPKKKREVVTAFYAGDKVIIRDDLDGAQSIHDKGVFGEFVDKNLELSLNEGLYLLERNRIRVLDGRKKELSYRAYILRAKKHDARFYTRYAVYRDIRTRGYITKAALKYGADFSVYPRGKNPKTAHSRWLLFAVSSDELFDWRKFAAMNRVAHSVKKHLLVGIVDSMSDVTYYEIKWKRP
jgi:tRNA-intron endonuclease